MELSEVTKLVDGCIYDALAPCSFVCPFALDIRSLMKKVAKGRIPAAYRELRTATVFPAVAVAICEGGCMGRCQRCLINDDPVDIKGLEKSILTLAGEQTPDIFAIPEKDAAVAIVGAGTAGLALALNMAQKKYPVTVFEKTDSLGGCLKSRDDFDVLKQDIEFQLSCEKIDFKFNTEITDLAELDSFSAIYIATGEDGCDFGLKDTFDPKLFTVSHKNTFMGGSLIGKSTLEGMSDAKAICMLMEGAIQTGKAQGSQPEITCHDHRLIKDTTEKKPHVAPADPALGYTKAEAKEEAGRCLQCTCTKCFEECEMIEKFRKPPKQMANETVADMGFLMLASRTMTRESFSCNMCSSCDKMCPGKVDMSGILQNYRVERVKEGTEPAAFHDFWLRELEQASTESFYASAPMGKDTCEYAFFPGCQLAATLPEQTYKLQMLLEEKFGAGIIMACCGASAWWAGEEELWQQNTEKLMEAWASMGKPTLLLACTTCADMFKKLAPEIPTKSVYDMLAQVEDLQMTKLFDKATIFDPCSSREGTEAYEAVRSLMSKSDENIEELPVKGKCCGWGGHMRTANPELYDKITGNRISYSELPYYVYCASCREVFMEKGKECRHILENIFGETDEIMHISQKHENRLELKEKFMNHMEGKEFTPEKREWDDIEIIVSPELRAEMECWLISDDDIRECIYESIQNNDRFVDEDGIFLASNIKRVMTYWVEYREVDGKYEIINAYCHRMKFITEA